jgi:hypothetical protein
MAKETGSFDQVPGRSPAGSPDADDKLAWQRFVSVHGKGALNRDLAVVLGRTVEEIEQLKTALKGGGKGPTSAAKKGAFEVLFRLWHGRPPTDDEWPAPARYARRGYYEWLTPEIAMLATLVGQMGTDEMAEVLTARLIKITGDNTAKRDRMAVQNQIARMGLMVSDVLGGLTVADAGKEIGSYTLVHQSIRNGHLKARRVGRNLVIPHKAWKEWKAKVQAPPENFVQLSTLKGPLSIRSDKLSEFCRIGYVPGAVQAKPYGTKNVRTTQFGSWYVPKEVAEQLVADRRAGRPMPWHGKPLMENLKVTFRLWQKRQHPADCATCAEIWGEKGAPRDFDDYMVRYPPIEHGAKRHLTMVWNPGQTIAELAAQAGRSEQYVRRAMANGVLASTKVGRVWRITRTDGTRWIARNCPTGDGEKSWVSIDTAVKQYLFTREELDAFIAQGTLKAKVGMEGAMRGIRYVLRQQCAQLREKLGFSEEQTAARAKVTVPQLRILLEGVNWRGAKGIPLTTVQAVIKRVQSQQGLTVEQAALSLGVTSEWIDGCIADGTITVKRNKWDERLYLSEPMLERLRKAQLHPATRARPAPPGGRLSEAAGMAGVSSTTLIRWAEDGEVRRMMQPSGWHYDLEDVRARARIYWRTVRYKRARMPAWLHAEQQAPAAVGCATSVPNATFCQDTETANAACLVASKARATELVEALSQWLAAPKIYIRTLLPLRQQRVALDGLPSEWPSTVRGALKGEFSRLGDLDFVPFDDLDLEERRDAIEMAIRFVGISNRHLDDKLRKRLQAAAAIASGALKDDPTSR